MNNPDDEELAARAQGGCAASLDQLLRRYQVPVLHFLQHRGPRADAEDLLQETFLRVWTHLDRYSRRWRFQTWLFTIARRVSSNGRRRRQPAADDEALQAAPAARPGPAEAVAEEESRRRLWQVAAGVLSEDETAALWLHYVEDLPVGEVAAVLGRPALVVKMQMFRARRKLLPALRRLGYAPALVRSDPAAGAAGESVYSRVEVSYVWTTPSQ